MNCPHCQQNSVSFYPLYIWPFKTICCSLCQGESKLASQPLLSLISLCLGLLFIVPVMWSSSAWVIVCAILLIYIDYQIDKRFRYLQVV